jgi:hypothetical protein
MGLLKPEDTGTRISRNSYIALDILLLKKISVYL